VLGVAWSRGGVPVWSFGEEGSVSSYAEFLGQKATAAQRNGLAAPKSLAGHLFPFQAACVDFLLRAGSGGLFLDTGLGKTACELEWSQHAAEATNGKALILTPLAVARQIEREGKRWGYPVRVIRAQRDAGAGINVCNYDRLERLDPSAFGSIALDEASILKSFAGATSRALRIVFSDHRFRLAATATPAPNDHTEIGTQAEFLGILRREDMLVRWFINDGSDTKSWRLKGHAIRPFWNWMASWSRMAGHPRDLGDDVPGFDLPALNVIRHRAEEPQMPIGGGLFGAIEVSATDMFRIKRATSAARARVVADLVTAEPDEPWVIWCDTNDEADAVAALLPDAREVRGSDSIDEKEAIIAAFGDGSLLQIITKSSITGWGLNWQHCRRMVFVGRSFSYEAWYQAVRRCWRFGQTSAVEAHLVVAEGEDHIGRVIDRKADDHTRMKAEMVAAMRRAMGRSSEQRVAYDPAHEGRLPEWL
jgi:superfamily II DNA or RNA helicase